jgi:hypothetical protein
MCGRAIQARPVEFAHFTGTEPRVSVARAEGPAVSSHAREGVVCGGDDMEVRRTGTKPVSECRAFGPRTTACCPPAYGRGYALSALRAWDELSSPSGPLVAQKNFLRLNPPDHVTCDGSLTRRDRRLRRVSEPHSRVKLSFATAPDDPRHKSRAGSQAGCELRHPLHGTT